MLLLHSWGTLQPLATGHVRRRAHRFLAEAMMPPAWEAGRQQALSWAWQAEHVQRSSSSCRLQVAKGVARDGCTGQSACSAPSRPPAGAGPWQGRPRRSSAQSRCCGGAAGRGRPQLRARTPPRWSPPHARGVGWGCAPPRWAAGLHARVAFTQPRRGAQEGLVYQALQHSLSNWGQAPEGGCASAKALFCGTAKYWSSLAACRQHMLQLAWQQQQRWPPDLPWRAGPGLRRRRKSAPRVGLEPTTTRLRVLRSRVRPGQAPLYRLSYPGRRTAPEGQAAEQPGLTMTMIQDHWCNGGSYCSRYQVAISEGK